MTVQQVVAGEGTARTFNAPPRAAVLGWILFGWAAEPFFMLVTTFVFSPYFASHVAPDPATGQSLWGYATSVAGLVIAILSPVLGAIADAGGRRKPWIAGFGALLVIGSAVLWIGRPGDQTTIVPLLVAFAIATVGVEFAIVFNNAMMPTLVPPERIGRLSGTGWAMGYVGGLISLILVLGTLAASSDTGKTLLGLTPLFGLDPASHQGDRITGPLTSVWFVVFALPMFLFTPDHAPKLPLRPAVRAGLIGLRRTLADLPRERALATFLIANMVYADGLVALFAFGGIYAAGTFGWQTLQIGVFGILLASAGMLGALVGGRLDDRLGPKTVIAGSITVLLLASAAILTVDREHLLFVIKVAPPQPGGALFAAPAERAYLALGLLIGAVAGPLQAASRSLLIRLAPRDRLTQFFGLFALSGKLTSFLAPLAVGLVTALTMSQKAGMAVLIAFFLAGLVLLLRVEEPG